MFDAKTLALSVVTADPDDFEALREAQLASGRARGEGGPRAACRRQGAHREGLLGRHPCVCAARPPSARADATRCCGSSTRGDIVDDAPTARRASRRRGCRRRFQRRGRHRSVDGVGADRCRARGSASPVSPDRGRTQKVSDASFVELLHVLVSLLESSRADLRGHSAEVARLVRRMGEKLGLDSAIERDARRRGVHPRSRQDGAVPPHDAQLQRVRRTQGRRAEGLGDARASARAGAASGRGDPDRLANVRALRRQGFPRRARREGHPAWARASSRSATRTRTSPSNPRNPFRKTLAPQEACVAIAKHKDTIFDPNLVDVFRNAVLGEELTARLLATRSQALLVDADPEETTVLELRMIEQGFVVKTARERRSRR